MVTFEDLRMIDMLSKFKAELIEIYSSGSVKKFKPASVSLQNIYNFYLTAQNGYKEQEEDFKNLFSSFNYAAVIINDGIKQGNLKKEDSMLLGECIEIMVKCCDKISASLKGE